MTISYDNMARVLPIIGCDGGDTSDWSMKPVSRVIMVTINRHKRSSLLLTLWSYDIRESAILIWR
jgi:hypothetical protein